MRSTLVILFGTVLVAASCSHEFEPPDRAERVREAAVAYDASVFDTVTWASEDSRVTEGNSVYAAECRRCHGTLGAGGTDYARERRLEVPSLVEPEWKFAQIDTLRRLVSIGHEFGMPVYSDGDLTPREVDGVVAYVLFVLRPDVLGPN